MVVPLRAFHLTDASRSPMAQGLEKGNDLESPVAGKTHALSEVALDREFPGEGVAERGKVREGGMRSDEPSECREQGGEHQPRDSSMEAIGEAAVVGLDTGRNSRRK